jgi:hypothetical protein
LLRRRSRAEIAFRVHQEWTNAWLRWFPANPALPPEAPAAPLPEARAVAAALRGTAYAGQVEDLARSILRHEFPLLGFTVQAGPEIRWRRDYVAGRESGLSYFRCVPYLSFEKVGDHKLIWELNRHQHLIVLAQAALFNAEYNAEGPFVTEIEAQLESWWEQNPFHRGINWASALEVALRALSWLWVDHIAGASLRPEIRRRLHLELFRHGCHVENNLSVYFSPNTHLLGEVVALAALAAAYPHWPRAAQWRETAERRMPAELQRQVHGDGAHFEHASYYHAYALDMFLLYYVLTGRPEPMRPALARMAGFLDALLAEGRWLPLLGDDDGGRLFHPYGPRREFACATLATCAALFDRPEWLRAAEDLHVQAYWWLGPLALHPRPAARRSTLFPDAGVAVMQAPSVQVIADAGGFGFGRGGHSHSDALSMIVRHRDAELLTDSGACTYVGDARWRDWFRGSAAHNTVRIDGMDQAEPDGPFAWNGRPKVRLSGWHRAEAQDFLDAACRYRGFTHRRRILFLKPGRILVLDKVDGPPGSHLIEQFWHPGADAQQESARAFNLSGEAQLLLAGDPNVFWGKGGEHGWASPAFGQREAAPVIVVSRNAPLPVWLAAAVVIGERAGGLELAVEGEDATLALDSVVVRFPSEGLWTGV